jgi:2-oxoglutarate dehydrogenase E1 component
MIRLVKSSVRSSFCKRKTSFLQGSRLTRFLSTKVDSFLSGSNSVYVEQMYDAWKRDPSSVHLSWQAYFSNLDVGVDPSAAFNSLPTVNGSVAASAGAASSAVKSDSLGLSYLISAYQVRGHEMANLDPLGIHPQREKCEGPPELDYTYHGFTEADLDRKLNLLGNSSGGLNYKLYVKMTYN